MHIPHHAGKDNGRDSANETKPSKAEAAQYGHDNRKCEIIVTNRSTSGCVCCWWMYNGHFSLNIGKRERISDGYII